MFKIAFAASVIFTGVVAPNDPSTLARADSLRPVALQIGGQPDKAACPMMGKIRPGTGSGIYTLYNGPGLQFGAKANFTDRDHFYVCSIRGLWLGVIIKDRRNGECDFSFEQHNRKTYRGSCTYGWIKRTSDGLVLG